MNLACRLVLLVLCLGLTSCLFKEPVFTGGFGSPMPGLAGVWMIQGESPDPRDQEFAVVLPMGDSLMLHYPVGRKGNTYFEARPLTLKGQQLLQLRFAGTFDDGVPDKDTPVFTVLWLQKTAEGKLNVRSLKSDGPHTVGPTETRKILEDANSDWGSIFEAPQEFTRLNDK